jgi:hypothetical protein
LGPISLTASSERCRIRTSTPSAIPIPADLLIIPAGGVPLIRLSSPGARRRVSVDQNVTVSSAAALGAASVADSGRTSKPTAGGAAFFSDASVLQPALAGVPTILFGPGATERMHQVDEHVSVADLHTAARCYAALLIDRIRR